MKIMQTTLFVVTLAVVGMVYGQSSMSGKCKTENIKPITLDAKMAEGKWNLVYVTDTERARELDHSSVIITPTGNNTFHTAATQVLKDNKVESRDFKLTLENNVLISEFEEDGKISHYKMYPLALTGGNAIFFYHCSDTGALPYDVRFIEIPVGKTLSEEDRKKLLDLDKSLNFVGNLYELPNKMKQM